MSTLTLAFAENLLAHDDNNDYAATLLSDDHTFPPLSATTTGFELVKDEVLFTGENTVWVNARTYAEAAEKGGVVHEPISVSGAALIAAPTSHHRHAPLAKEEHDDEEDDDCADQLYYDVKSLSTDKAMAENTVHARKLKTIEYAYHRDLRNNLQKLPEYANDTPDKGFEEMQDVKDFIEACQKVLAYLDYPQFKDDHRPTWYHKGSILDIHREFLARVLQGHKSDAMVQRVLKEVELRLDMQQHDAKALHQTPTHHSRWFGYHWKVSHILENELIPLYEDKLRGLDYTQNRTRKQRLWLIRSAIPEKKYMHGKANRTQCAYEILDEYE